MSGGAIAHALADALQEMDAKAGGRDHLAYTASVAVRTLADDMEQCPANHLPFGSDLDEAYWQHCNARQQSARTDQESEFWRRLAGSVRKAGNM